MSRFYIGSYIDELLKQLGQDLVDNRPSSVDPEAFLQIYMTYNVGPDETKMMFDRLNEHVINLSNNRFRVEVVSADRFGGNRIKSTQVSYCRRCNNQTGEDRLFHFGPGAPVMEYYG